MSGIIYADYELMERAGGTETTALFKGQHTLIPERLRAVRMPQSGSESLTLTYKPERVKALFGQLCQITAQVAHVLDSAAPSERGASERIAFIEAIHFDADQSPDSDKQDYIVTEWVAGGTLADKVAEGALSLPASLTLASDVLEGLEFAHGRGIVHGNLKPSNILIAPDGQPRLADFGGNILEAGVPPRYGSIPYLSPEQLEPGTDLDARADLFSLTLILYEMLTGKRAPRLLSPTHLPSKVNPHVSAACDELILQGLQQDPRQRFRSAREMRDRLLQTLEPARSTARPLAASQAAVAGPAAAQAFVTAGSGLADGQAAANGSAEIGSKNGLQNDTQNGLLNGREEAFSSELGQPAPLSASAVVVNESEPEPEPAPAPVVAQRRTGERRVNERDSADMVWVPGGTLQMGSEREADEMPVHSVDVAGFWMYANAVTQTQYLACIAFLREQLGPTAPQKPSLFKRGDANGSRAAAGVDWNYACDYAKWAGGRLPTEAEWEWAARGPEQLSYPWGNAWPDGDDWQDNRANVSESGLYEPIDVGRYPQGASWCGALDLLGNTFEWCSSLYRPYPYASDDGREKPKAGEAHVLRGGSASMPAHQVTATARFAPSSNTALTGFRLVIDAQ